MGLPGVRSLALIPVRTQLQPSYKARTCGTTEQIFQNHTDASETHVHTQSSPRGRWHIWHVLEGTRTTALFFGVPEVLRRSETLCLPTSSAVTHTHTHSQKSGFSEHADSMLEQSWLKQGKAFARSRTGLAAWTLCFALCGFILPLVLQPHEEG